MVSSVALGTEEGYVSQTQHNESFQPPKPELRDGLLCLIKTVATTLSQRTQALLVTLSRRTPSK